MLNDLLLLSGVDIPFVEAKTAIHPPSIKEIAYIGEKSLFIACELLRFSKKNLSDQDKIRLENQTDFDIIMVMLNNSDNQSLENKDSVIKLLTLLFPNKQAVFGKDSIILKTDENIESQDVIINNDNYEQFKKILSAIFCLNKNEKEEDYKPVNKKAQEIAEKLKKGKKKIAEMNNGGNQKISILSRYVSILSVGEQKNMNDLLDYTVFQLYDEFERYGLKTSYDIYIQAKMAGAKDLKEVENWMKDIHEKTTY